MVTPYQEQIEQGDYVIEGMSSRCQTRKIEPPNVFEGPLCAWHKVLEIPW